MHRYTLSYFADSIVVLLLFACLLYSHEYDKCGRVRRISHDYDKIEEQTYCYYSSGRLQEAVSRLLFRTPSLQMSDDPEQLALLERVFEVYSYICQIIYRTELYSKKQWFKTSISKLPNGMKTMSRPKSSSCSNLSRNLRSLTSAWAGWREPTTT